MTLMGSLALIPPGNGLNNRELATLIWLGVGLAWVLSRKDVRPLIGNVVRAAAHPVMIVPAVALWMWSIALVIVASGVHLWSGDLVKDTAIWMIGPALVLYFSVMKVAKDPRFFGHLARDAVRYTVLVEFYVNLRVFSLPVELILVPAVTLLALLAAVAGRDAKYRQVKTLIDVVMSIAGVALLVYVTVALVGGWRQEDLGHDVRDLALPVWLTLGTLPYLYGLSLFAGYQSQFVRMDFWTRGDRRAAMRTKLALLVELNFRTQIVQAFAGHWLNDLAEARTFADAREVVRRYRSRALGPSGSSD